MDQRSTNGDGPPEEFSLDNGLTPIHRRIHCAATPYAPGLTHEIEQIAIDHFLGTLAEVALAIARRREQVDS